MIISLFKTVFKVIGRFCTNLNWIAIFYKEKTIYHSLQIHAYILYEFIA